MFDRPKGITVPEVIRTLYGIFRAYEPIIFLANGKAGDTDRWLDGKTKPTEDQFTRLIVSYGLAQHLRKQGATDIEIRVVFYGSGTPSLAPISQIRAGNYILEHLLTFQRGPSTEESTPARIEAAGD